MSLLVETLIGVEGGAPCLDAHEMAVVAQLRSRFEAEVADSAADPAFFGDLALARVLRAHGNDLEQSSRWFSKFLSEWKALRCDERCGRIRRAANAHMVEAELWQLDILPSCDTAKHFLPQTFSGERLTPQGDVLCYIPLVDWDISGVRAAWETQELLEFFADATILRSVQLDALSHATRRMVQVHVIVDVENANLGRMLSDNKDVLAEYSRTQENLAIEVTASICFLNVGWWAKLLWAAFSGFAPEQLHAKCSLLAGGPTDDLLSLVGESQLMTLMGTRCKQSSASGSQACTCA